MCRRVKDRREPGQGPAREAAPLPAVVSKAAREHNSGQTHREMPDAWFDGEDTTIWYQAHRPLPASTHLFLAGRKRPASAPPPTRRSEL